MRTAAPNFTGTYPLAGERIGPAWRAGWQALSETAWVDAKVIIEAMTRDGGISEMTALNLLRQARQRSIIEVSYQARDESAGSRRPPARYRVHIPGRDSEGKTGKLPAIRGGKTWQKNFRKLQKTSPDI